MTCADHEGLPHIYYGVPVPDELKIAWDQPEAEWWRRGVRDTAHVEVRAALARHEEPYDG